MFYPLAILFIDKIAALALQVQESPLHQLNALDTLVGLAASQNQARASQMALEALKDLLIHNLLPSDRKLVPFDRQLLGHKLMTMHAAVTLYFEGQLLIRISKIVDVLESLLRNPLTIEFHKKSCISITYDLLNSTPEQEGRLLALLVNKLGDPMASVSNKTAEMINLLLKHHPGMKLVVVKEVRKLLYNTHMSPKAIFTGTVFLTQMELIEYKDIAVAEELMDCYIGLFEQAIPGESIKSNAVGAHLQKKAVNKNKKGKDNNDSSNGTSATSGSRLLMVLLNGINRAYAVCIHNTSKKGEGWSKHLDALYKLVHTSTFATATQALVLLSHTVLLDETSSTNTAKKGQKPIAVTKGQEELDVINRYYKALYSQLLSDEVSIL